MNGKSCGQKTMPCFPRCHANPKLRKVKGSDFEAMTEGRRIICSNPCRHIRSARHTVAFFDVRAHYEPFN